MKFVIEQIALCPTSGEAAKKLLAALGISEWAEDHVGASGKVFGEAASNEADLSFNYQASPEDKPLELELLQYTAGKNWMAEKSRRCSVSHLGMHVSGEELVEVRKIMAEHSIEVAQEVFTHSHTNPAIAGKRHYNYVIFDTRALLGVDLKFIVRYNAA